MTLELQQLLTEGGIAIQGRLVDASNATLFVTISRGADSISAIYKPVSGERPLWDFESGDLASRERAAYLISEASGIRCVPLTIVRDGPFGPGMVQQWITVDETVDLATYFREDREELRKVALFDAIINNTDRKIGHLLVQSDGTLKVCDHGVTFHHEDKLRTVLWQWAGSPLNDQEIQLLSSLEEEIKSGAIDELKELITEEEELALLARINRLLGQNSFPLPNPDWPSVPWPPF